MLSGFEQFHVPSVEGKTRVVIVGGGFAGMRLTQVLLKSKNIQVVMLDRHNHHLFQPLLYQVATLGLDPDSIAEPIRKHYGNNTNFFFRLAIVESIDFKANSVNTNLGNIEYDYLVIANGSKTNYFGNEANFKKAFPLKQLYHALGLRNQIITTLEEAVTSNSTEKVKACLTFIVVGGGATGIEVSGALAELRKHILPNDYPDLDSNLMRIVLVEGGGRVLSGLSPELGETALENLRDLNVEVLLNTTLKSYDGETATLGDGSTIAAKTLIWGAGVQGNIIEGIPSEVIEHSRIVVDQFNKVGTTENVFAIGDVALMKTEKYPKGHPMVAQTAIQMGKLLGVNLLNSINNKPLVPFEYNDKGSMATIGRNKAVVDLPHKIKFAGRAAWFVWMFVHLLSIAGFRNKLVVSLNWFWRYLTYDRGNRVLIRNPKDVSR